MRRALPIGLLCVVALVLPAAADVPEGALFEVDGITYQYIMGVNGTVHTQLGPGANATDQMPLNACAFVMLHPPTSNGRVMIKGLYGRLTSLDFGIDQFRLPDGKRGYHLDSEVTQDGLPVLADLAITGNATMRVGQRAYNDPVSTTGNRDLDRELEVPDLLGTLALLTAGTRDDATGAVLEVADEDDVELHVRLRASPEATPRSIQMGFRSPAAAPAPAPYVPLPAVPSEAYGARHAFSNHKLGGTATLDITTTALAPSGMNEFHFSVMSPNDDEVGNVTLTPAVGADDQTTVTFPLDAFGDYVITVTGANAFGSYDIAATLAPPADFDLHLWWENVTFGYQAHQDYLACNDEVQSPNAILATVPVVARPPPPRFPLQLAVLGVVAAVGVVTLAVKLASDQLSLSAFRKAK